VTLPCWCADPARRQGCEVCAVVTTSDLAGGGPVGQCACGAWVCEAHSSGRCDWCGVPICWLCARTYERHHQPRDQEYYEYCEDCYRQT
jgi:hypothetical protein